VASIRTLGTSDVLRAQIIVPEHVVHRAFPAETVLLNLNTGKYHGLNPTAGRMFEVLNEVPSVRDCAARLAEEFEVPLEMVERDLTEFCSGLLERGLLEIAPT
jgi:coenzyme PQQ synthesis protein D (PqqD)